MNIVLLAMNADPQLLVDRGASNLPPGWIIESMPYDGVSAVPNEWIVMTDDEMRIQLSNNEAAYEAFISGQVDLVAIQVTKIKQAMTFGHNLIAEFGAGNVIAQLTPIQVAGVAQKLLNVQLLLLSGSLYTAIAALQGLVPDAILTTAVIKNYTNQIQTYLEIPLT
jgi:hypothetical protein